MNSFMREILEHMHRHIPLTRAMGIRIDALSENSIEISAPLEPNINHRESVFGGSLSALGITSGWALIYSLLAKRNIANRLVIQESNTQFLLPANGVFTARCTDLSQQKKEKFIHTFNRYSKARIELMSEIYSENKRVAIHQGSYVALKA